MEIKKLQALISVWRIYKQLYANKEEQATRVSLSNTHTYNKESEKDTKEGGSGHSKKEKKSTTSGLLQ